MSYHAPDHENIMKLFIKYTGSKRTLSISKPGFFSYLALKIGYPGWLIKEIKTQVRKDLNLSEFIDSAIEGALLDGMNAGIYKEGGVKFTLKNQFGYADNPESNEHSESSTVKTVSYRAATQEDVKNA